MDAVFKALADPTRRSLLDALYEEDPQTLGALARRLPMTRIGVMKHLRVLEEAGLVKTKRHGREKLHFLNPVPIRLVHDRWVSKYAEPWAAGLTSLKRNIEEEQTMEKVFEIYKKDVMKSARSVDGSSSFDPEDLILMTDRATFRGFAKDEQSGVRQLVATVLSNSPEKDDLSTLVTLLDDKDIEVSSASAVGIAKLNDPTASQLLVKKLGEVGVGVE